MVCGIFFFLFPHKYSRAVSHKVLMINPAMYIDIEWHIGHPPCCRKISGQMLPFGDGDPWWFQFQPTREFLRSDRVFCPSRHKTHMRHFTYQVRGFFLGTGKPGTVGSIMSYHLRLFPGNTDIDLLISIWSWTYFPSRRKHHIITAMKKIEITQRNFILYNTEFETRVLIFKCAHPCIMMSRFIENRLHVENSLCLAWHMSWFFSHTAEQ